MIVLNMEYCVGSIPVPLLLSSIVSWWPNIYLLTNWGLKCSDWAISGYNTANIWSFGLISLTHDPSVTCDIYLLCAPLFNSTREYWSRITHIMATESRRRGRSQKSTNDDATCAVTVSKPADGWYGWWNRILQLCFCQSWWYFWMFVVIFKVDGKNISRKLKTMLLNSMLT